MENAVKPASSHPLRPRQEASNSEVPIPYTYAVSLLLGLRFEFHLIFDLIRRFSCLERSPFFLTDQISRLVDLRIDCLDRFLAFDLANLIIIGLIDLF